jgi:hypothetical protein
MPNLLVNPIRTEPNGNIVISGFDEPNAIVTIPGIHTTIQYNNATGEWSTTVPSTTTFPVTINAGGKSSILAENIVGKIAYSGDTYPGATIEVEGAGNLSHFNLNQATSGKWNLTFDNTPSVPNRILTTITGTDDEGLTVIKEYDTVIRAAIIV